MLWIIWEGGGFRIFLYFYYVVDQFGKYIFRLDHWKMLLFNFVQLSNIECDCNANMIKNVDISLKRICYKTVEYKNRFVMVRSHTYIYYQNIVECTCLPSHLHQRMW